MQHLGGLFPFVANDKRGMEHIGVLGTRHLISLGFWA